MKPYPGEPIEPINMTGQEVVLSLGCTEIKIISHKAN